MSSLLPSLARSTRALWGERAALVRPTAPAFSCRRFVATVPTTPTPPPAIYVSDSDDPFFNLAFEDWLFRKTDPRQIILYMYRNKPSVIIGRNQNPWKEINLHRLKDLDIPFVRRKSGGGTVYHDLGNTNYCVYVPRLEFERRTNAALVARALSTLSIPAFVNDRNDICVGDFKMSSAFKLVNARAYHHGTMLIEAKLDDLRGLLGNTKDTMVTKGVASVSSPVKNLRDSRASIDHDQFCEAVSSEFVKLYGGDGIVQRVDESELGRKEYVREVHEELKSWDWMYGQTPEFTHDLTGSFDEGDVTFNLKSRHALITSAEVVVYPGTTLSEQASMLAKTLVGDRYGSLELAEEAVGKAVARDKEQLGELVDWLKREM